MTKHEYHVTTDAGTHVFTRLEAAYKFTRKYNIPKTQWWTKHYTDKGFWSQHRGFRTAREIRQVQKEE